MHEVIMVELTEAQKVANKTLQEGQSDPHSDAHLLRDDIRALERAVREQKAQRMALQSKLEQQYDESVLATKQLRKILAAAEQKVSHRDAELAELESRLMTCELEFTNNLAEAKHQHAVEFRHLQAIAVSAEERAEQRNGIIARITAELEQLREDNAYHLREAAVSFYEKSLAEDAMRRSQSELVDEVNELRAEISQLQRGLECDESEKSKSEENRQRVQSKQAAKIDDLQQQLQLAKDQSRESDAAACRLQEQAEELRIVVDLLREDTAAAKVTSRNENAELQASLAAQQRELETLSTEFEQTNNELDRKAGALERVRLENERFQEIENSHFTTMQSRIDQLIVALDSERQKRQACEQEARRLSVSRSRRISFLSQQRERLQAELTHLREQSRRRAEGGTDAKQLVFEQLGRTGSERAA